MLICVWGGEEGRELLLHGLEIIRTPLALSVPRPAMTWNTAWHKLGAELLLLSSSAPVLLLSCGEIIFPLKKKKKTLSYLHSIDSFPVRDGKALYIHHNERFLFDVTAWLETGALLLREKSSIPNCPFCMKDNWSSGFPRMEEGNFLHSQI